MLSDKLFETSLKTILIICNIFYVKMIVVTCVDNELIINQHNDIDNLNYTKFHRIFNA